MPLCPGLVDPGWIQTQSLVPRPEQHHLVEQLWLLLPQGLVGSSREARHLILTLRQLVEKAGETRQMVRSISRQIIRTSVSALQPPNPVCSRVGKGSATKACKNCIEMEANRMGLLAPKLQGCCKTRPSAAEPPHSMGLVTLIHGPGLASLTPFWSLPALPCQRQQVSLVRQAAVEQQACSGPF
jgi:hypothetical protein